MNILKSTFTRAVLLSSSFLVLSTSVFANVKLQTEVKISNIGLHFDGKDLDFNNMQKASKGTKYDFFFGPNISAHGDAVKTYKHYVFMTWYKGGKNARNVMLSRYNTRTGKVATIQFPHKHTGFRGNPLIGESHNTIGLAVSPLNGTIHMVYDMHAYTNSNHDNKFKDDFFRYSFSKEGVAELPDSQFTLDKFVKDTSSIKQGNNDYKHLTMTGNLSDKSNFSALTYPKFFTTDDGTLLLYMRLGGNNNGAYVFNRYDADSQTWSTFQNFNYNNQRSRGNAYNWGLYGNMKYVNGKLRVGFQQRSSNNNDKFLYQNGLYYAYSDHPNGNGQWKDHTGAEITFPLVNSNEIKIFEPGNYINHKEANSIHIVGGFDWTETARGDIHIISQARSTNKKRANFQSVKVHSYKPAGASDFIHTTDFVGANSIYTSGDDIYIIGLEDGKPFVEKALGGTNNFTRVYKQKGGKDFNHGVIYIKDGKVYYYLMEKASGNARPLYLQIIDLGIEQEAQQPPEVSFSVPRRNITEGYKNLKLAISASSPNQGVGIKHVRLFVDGSLVRQENVAPFEWGHASFPNELLGLSTGSYTFKAIATDENGLQSETSIPVTVASASSNDGCASTIDLAWNTRHEVTLSGNATCIRFDRNLAGETLQLWDSDTNTTCDFRGTVSAINGTGSVTVTSNYTSGNNLTGDTFLVSSSNRCPFVKLRAN